MLRAVCECKIETLFRIFSHEPTVVVIHFAWIAMTTRSIFPIFFFSLLPPPTTLTKSNTIFIFISHDTSQHACVTTMNSPSLFWRGIFTQFSSSSPAQFRSRRSSLLWKIKSIIKCATLSTTDIVIVSREFGIFRSRWASLPSLAACARLW